MSQVSYSVVGLQSETVYDYNIIQVDDSCSCDIESSYIWSNLIQGEYQFSVVAFTSEGPGEAASLTLSALPNINNYGKLCIW